MQIVVLLASQIQQKIVVCRLCGIDVCFVPKVRIVGVELLGEINELTTDARILKQYDVLSIQTDRLHVLFLLKKCWKRMLMLTLRYAIYLEPDDKLTGRHGNG